MESKRGKIAVLVGGQYGSEGKGAIAAHVANKYDYHVRVGSPNAGHTIWWRGSKHVMQSIPCGWINPNASIVIGRGALLNMKQFMKELVHILRYYPDFLDRLFIDPEAGILDEKFHIEEGGTEGEMHRRIGSTGEGVGPARIARLKRDKSEFRQFKDIAFEYGLENCIAPNTPKILADAQDLGYNVLIEGTQGSALSLLHSHYPYCTSVETNAAGIIAEVGIAPSRVTDVILVCRTYPIRVAGNSGPMENETTWEKLNARIKELGGNEIAPEKTTVTHKVRRIAEWDDALFEQSCILNAPTQIALTFADYIDPCIYGVTDSRAYYGSSRIQEFVAEHNIKNLAFISTGPETVIDLEEG